MNLTRRTFLQASGAATVAALMPRRAAAAVAARAMGDRLCLPEDATVTALRSGSWQEPGTWSGGAVPPAGAKVYIPPNLTVTNNGATEDVLWIHAAGVLKACDHCDTQINVHTIYVPMGGKIDLGGTTMVTRSRCVVEWLPGPWLPGDTTQLSRGLICHGEFMAHGLQKTPWGTVLADLPVGATTLKLPSATGWNAGDRLVICGTDSVLGYDQRGHVYQSEFVTVTSVLHASDGATVTFSPPLKYRHFRWRKDTPFHCGNLSRNVVFRSRDPSTISNRGHLMFMSAMCRMFNTAVEGCGRTDGSQPVTDPRFDAYGEMVPGSDANVRARYAVHWHRIGQLSAQALCSGCVVDGSPKWGFLNHDSNVRISDCISTRCFGSGFATEEGQERGAFDKCLSVLNRGQGDYIVSTDSDHGRAEVADWGVDGSGFWLQGGMVDVTNCVACDNSGRGFALFNRAMTLYPLYPPNLPPHLRFPIEVSGTLLPTDYGGISATPSSTVPQRVFDGNTAYGNKVAVQGWSGATHNASSRRIWPASVNSKLSRLTLWGRGALLHLEYMRQVDIDGLTIVGDKWRGEWTHIMPFAPIHLRSPYITIRNVEIDGFTRDHAYPNPVPISTDDNNSEGPHWKIQGSYPVNNRNGTPITLQQP